MKRIMMALACAGCFMVPSCLTIDQSGLLGIGENLLCEIATGGLPFSGDIDYCSVVNINLPDDLLSGL